VVENLVKRPKKTKKNYNIYSIKSPGPEGLAWAFKISSQALSHGLRRALAWLGLGFSGPGLAWLRASGQACTSLVTVDISKPRGLAVRISKPWPRQVRLSHVTSEVITISIRSFPESSGVGPGYALNSGGISVHRLSIPQPGTCNVEADLLSTDEFVGSALA
jgi:hypothetical protein